MKKYYEIEFYDIKENVGKGTTGITYTNKKIAIKTAKEIYKNLCNNDKKCTSVLVNKHNTNNDFVECVKEFSLKGGK